MRNFRHKTRPKKSGQGRPWPVTACGRLLALEAAGFVGLAWLESPASLRGTFAELWLSSSFALLALAAAITSITFLRLQPSGWTLAAMQQGATLLLALWQYFHGIHDYIFILMAYGVFLVVYLNHPEVRASFPQEPLPVEDDEEAEILQ